MSTTDAVLTMVISFVLVFFLQEPLFAFYKGIVGPIVQSVARLFG